MKKIIYITILSLMFSGCDNFLNIKPKSETIDSELFKTAEGYEDALYGVYGRVGSHDDLYGKSMNIELPEAMVINFSAGGQQGINAMMRRNWSLGDARNIYNGWWTRSYEAIGYVNNIINHIDNASEGDFRLYNLYKGESYALRAWLHFNVSNYFAVDYHSSNATLKAKAIPYVEQYSYRLTPFSSIEEVYSKIIRDLEIAEKCMKMDETLVNLPRNNFAAGFTSCRIIHINLYAVQALMARVYLQMGNHVKAAEYAKKVIESKKFPLLNLADFNNYEKGALCLKETIFGLYSTKVLASCRSLFGKLDSGLKPNTNYKALYEDQGPGGADRRKIWFDENGLFVKMLNKMYTSSNETDKYNGPSFPGFSVIRIPEMYYIMAESLLDTDIAEATKYLDYVIESRGMTKFADREKSTITKQDIFNERRKEYYGEGLLWSDMKRLKVDIFIDSNMTLNGSDDNTYTLPINPSVEGDFRD